MVAFYLWFLHGEDRRRHSLVLGAIKIFEFDGVSDLWRRFSLLWYFIVRCSVGGLKKLVVCCSLHKLLQYLGPKYRDRRDRVPSHVTCDKVVLASQRVPTYKTYLKVRLDRVKTSTSRYFQSRRGSTRLHSTPLHRRETQPRRYTTLTIRRSL